MVKQKLLAPLKIKQIMKPRLLDLPGQLRISPGKTAKRCTLMFLWLVDINGKK